MTNDIAIRDEMKAVERWENEGGKATKNTADVEEKQHCRKDGDTFTPALTAVLLAI